MIPEELKKLDTKKLVEELTKEQEALFKAKFDVQTGHSKASHQIEKHKSQVARINTLINQRNDQN